MSCRSTESMEEHVSSSMMICVSCGSKCPSISVSAHHNGGSPHGAHTGTTYGFRGSCEPSDTISIAGRGNHAANDPTLGNQRQRRIGIRSGDGRDETETHIERVVAFGERHVTLRDEVREDRGPGPG